MGSVEFTTRSPTARAPTGGGRRARRLVRAPRGPWERRSPWGERCRRGPIRRAGGTAAHTEGPRVVAGRWGRTQVTGGASANGRGARRLPHAGPPTPRLPPEDASPDAPRPRGAARRARPAHRRVRSVPAGFGPRLDRSTRGAQGARARTEARRHPRRGHGEVGDPAGYSTESRPTPIELAIPPPRCPPFPRPSTRTNESAGTPPPASRCSCGQ